MKALLSTRRRHAQICSVLEIIPQPSSTPETTASSLQSLPYDILLLIVRSLNEVSEEPYYRNMLNGQRKRWHLPHSLGALSLTSRYMRDVCLPIIFEEIIVRGTVSRVVARVGEMGELSSTRQHYIKSLHIRCVYSDGLVDMISSIPCDFDLLPVLTKLENLEKLEINFDRYIEEFWSGLSLLLMKSQPQKQLVRVHTLHMSPYIPDLWNLCPSLISLSTNRFPRFLTGISPAADISILQNHDMKCASEDFSKLRHLRIDTIGDDVLLSYLVKAAPQLESLFLKPAWGSHAPMPNCHPYFINQFISILSGFENLQHLSFPQDVPSDVEEMIYRAYERRRSYLIKRIGVACTSIKDVSFGRKWKVLIVRNPDGSVVTQPWLEGIEGQDMFSDRRTRDYPSLDDRDIYHFPVRARSTRWFCLGCIRSLLVRIGLNRSRTVHHR